MSASSSALAALIATLGPAGPAEQRCTVTELLVDQCTHCRPSPPAEPATGLAPWIAARYRGKCSSCGCGFEEFTDIRADGDGGWLARCCGDAAEISGLLPEPSLGRHIDFPAEPVTVPADAQPEPCQRCGFPTRVRVGGRPQHGGCEERPVGASPNPRTEGPPPSTVAEMREVLSALDASRPRSVQTALGPSELGTPCQRQIAMKLAGLPRQLPDKRPPWAPMQGTAMHTLMEEALRFHNGQLGHERWIIEDELQIDDDIPGHGDAFDTDTGTVVDWKYVGVTALREAKRKTVPNEQLVKPEYRVQAHLYGWGHARKGRDVRWVRLVFLARSHDFDDSAEWTEPYDPAIAEEAIQRYHATKALVAGLPLAANPALWAAVPAEPGKACDWCPFRRPGGPADGTGCPGNAQSKIDKQTAGLLA